uniref:Uncharacterized protein n=1 Tax=Panagrolaimus davidi TaxID=227884 RepID=A0A914P0C3_9BILA
MYKRLAYQCSLQQRHQTYNIAPIIMAFYCKFSSVHKNEIFPTESVIKENHLVISPLGTALPTHVSQENYFKDLRNQWNKKF